MRVHNECLQCIEEKTCGNQRQLDLGPFEEPPLCFKKGNLSVSHIGDTSSKQNKLVGLGGVR